MATLAILAGGASSRMGSPKAELNIAGKPILQYLLERFAWTGKTVLITAPGREKPKGWECFDREVVDAVAGEGPLRGILTALEAAHEMVVVTTVDMPALRGEQLRWLMKQLESRAEQGMMLRHNGRIEPFPSVYRQQATDVIRERLQSGRAAVHGLAEMDQFAAVDAPADWPEETWVNLNRPGDVEAFRRLRHV
ncbi:MAG TPA: molybdenum cofactor guanylyltransferase [Tepidisphaeraceae bacterium]|jgi:molybdopterin-guanine dinucleotide biosynthesis protein A|nr:molybdenum cofactor guanylyltransferase [Tepidisphaeraceae bacterium]